MAAAEARPKGGPRLVHSLAATLLTLVILALVLRRVPFPALATALHDADYRRFLALWKNCDPELRPRLDEAQARLARLDPRATRR